MRPLEPGLTLRAYRLVSRLGRGGDGDVWLADAPRGGQVALKARAIQGGEELRLRHEFERLRTLSLPNVVRVLEVGTDQGYVFFTMEVAQGRHFNRYVADAPTLTERVERLCKAGAAVASALGAIHRLNLAHRDLKPDNVMVDDEGRATILDFGNMRFGAAQDESGNFAGTVAYMAPEQRVGQTHDARVDRYALGVMLHEALSGQPASQAIPGRARATLLHLGSEVPRPLAGLIDALTALDPADRPTADDAAHILQSLVTGAPLPPGPWPAPPRFSGDATPLLTGSGVVVGPPGSGRRRMIEEARWLWYRKGYRSIAGSCRADRPFGALRAILAEIFAVQDPEQRRRIAGDQGAYLQAIWPELPLAVWAPTHSAVTPEGLAEALSAVLARLTPVALVLYDIDELDAGSAAVLHHLARHLPRRVFLWASSRHAIPSLPTVATPVWGPARDAEVVGSLLPPGASLPPLAGPTPLDSAARAWRVLAASRGEAGPARDMSPGLIALSILDDPFPISVARAVTDEADLLRSLGHLIPAVEREGDELWLRFADPGTRRLCEARQNDRVDLHLRAARAWETHPAELQTHRGAIHRIRAGLPDAGAWRQAIVLALDLASPSEAERWLQLKDLWSGGADDFAQAYVRLRAALELRPTRVTRESVDALAARARTQEEQAKCALIQLIWETHHGDPAAAIAQGVQWAGWTAGEAPMLAAELLRHVALARMDLDDLEAALGDCRRAVVLAREAAWRNSQEDSTEPGRRPPAPPRPPPLTRVEVEAATTLSAALLYAGRTREGTRLCEEMAERCRKEGLLRGQGAFLANLAAGQLYLGQRDLAAQSLSRCRAVQTGHGDPIILAYASTYQARLAIDRGDRPAARALLDEAMTIGQSMGVGRLVAEIWPLILESALQGADLAEAERAISAYGAGGVLSSADTWPAVYGRWLWLCGDLEGALAAVSVPRIGHSGELVAAERARLKLVRGLYGEALAEADALAERATRADFAEIVLFARLVGGAAAAVSDVQYQPMLAETRSSRWVHLYLGALHLDALRRQLRGENPAPVLRELRARSRDTGHTLYAALAREDAW